MMEEFINHLADLSGEIAKKYYRNFGQIDLKEDSSPVTIADREIEEILRKEINKTYPDHGIIGEEFGNEKIDAKFIWSIDPIDGTTSFTIGRPTFGTLISLIEDGKFISGLINQPINNERWLALKDQPTTLNGKEIQTRKCPDLTNATLCTTGPNYFSDENLTKFNNIAKNTKQTIYGSDCYGYGLVALGTVDIVIESGLKPHDFCALVPIIENAGGIMTNWQGEKLTINSDGNVVACGDRNLHSQIIKQLN